MKNKYITLSILAVVTVCAAALSDHSVSAGYLSPGPSASGHGNYWEASGELRTFSFHARTQDGVTKGSFVVNNRSSGTFSKETSTA